MPRTTSSERKKVPVTIQPNIGLDASARQAVVEILNRFLADEAVLALKTHLAAGHADGKNGSDLQPLFDAQYQQLNTISNEVVERIQILGGLPLSGLDKHLNSTQLEGDFNTVPGIVSLLADHEAGIRFLRENAQACAEMYEDQGTFALLVSAMRIHEKMAWLLRSNIALEGLDHGK